METLQSSDCDDYTCHELLCNEPADIRMSPSDSVLVCDERVLQNLLTTEDFYVSRSAYIIQSEVKPYMRNEVTKWMNAVCLESCCEEDVFSLAVNLLDRFLAVVDMEKQHLQLLGAATMFIASKLKEAFTLSVAKLVYYTDFSLSSSDILEMELRVLEVLQWDVMVITPYDVIRQILPRLHLDSSDLNKITDLTKDLIEICLTDSRFVTTPPSLLSSACLSLAVSHSSRCSDEETEDRCLHELCRLANIDIILGLKELSWFSQLFCVNKDCLRSCREQIQTSLASNQHGRSRYGLSDVTVKNSDQDFLSESKKQSSTPTDVTSVSVL